VKQCGIHPREAGQHHGITPVALPFVLVDGYWGATEQKSSIRRTSSDFLGSIDCVPQMLIFDVVLQDLNILK
jgi:hypothetical protein